MIIIANILIWCVCVCVCVRVVVSNATFNNISVIMWQSVLMVEETEVQTLSHNVESSTPRHEQDSNSR